MFKRGERSTSGRRWGWAKISAAIVAGVGGLGFWRKRRQPKQPPQ